MPGAGHPATTGEANGFAVPAILIRALKFCCLLTYAGGVVSTVAVLTHPLAHFLRLAAGFVLAMHALQVVFCWRQLRPYRGGMPASIVLTLLFGLLHWVPMRWQAQRARIDAPARGAGD